MDFRQQTVAELAASVRSGAIAARELVAHALERIDSLDGSINAFVAVDEDAAMAAAGRIDDAVAGGADPGPLAGIPLGVKDLEDSAGYVTARGSAVWAETPPATGDSVLVARLKAAGCVVVGKTTTPELGSKADTHSLAFGATLNPWDITRSAGGSSGGSAAAIAAGMVPLATGSDAGGSIRIPSALCGLSGLKPSLGRVPMGGANPPNLMHLSTRAPMAKRSTDIALALSAVAGADPSDLRAISTMDPLTLDDRQRRSGPLRVAWSPTLGYAPLDDAVRALCEQAVGTLAGLGAEIVEVPEVFSADPVQTWLTMGDTYNARTLEQYRGTDMWDRIDPELRESVIRGLALRGVDVVRAEDACHHLNLRLVELFADFDLLATPVIASRTPLSQQVGMLNGVPEDNWLRFTYPFNMTRSPAGTVCAGLSPDGLPVGLHLVGPQHDDAGVLRTMIALEEALAFADVADVDGLAAAEGSTPARH